MLHRVHSKVPPPLPLVLLGSTVMRSPLTATALSMTVWLVVQAVVATAKDSPETVAFFESRIRPVLVEHCYQCHSSESEEVGGSLLLDSSDGMLVGGDSGPTIAPGDTSASLLVAAIRYESSEMPPSGKLPEHVIHDFEKWIQAGAVDPRQGHVATIERSEIDLDKGRQFWAFQPIRADAASTRSPDSRTAIDDYLNDKLRQAGLAANEEAPPEVRLRRLSFDLTGLPPDATMLAQWLADPSPAHWNRIVDSMLGSHAFAEHWARHWMDIARYADSNGSDFNATHHEAWRYRDYLIRAFAQDRPLDVMIRQQIAGDLLPASDDAERYDNVVATTFLMLGTKMLSERDKAKLQMDVVDEQIDTVGRAFLGLTLGCARCHDHKFDPIPMIDYYALAGIFRNTVTLNGESQKYVSTWNRIKLPLAPERLAAIAQHKAKTQAIEMDLKQAQATLQEIQQRSEVKLPGIIIDDAQAVTQGNWKASTFSKHFVGAGYLHDNQSQKGMCSIEYTTRLPHAGIYEVRVSYAPGGNRAANVPVTILCADGSIERTLDQRRTTIEPHWHALGQFPFTAENDAVVTLRNEGTEGYVIADAVQFLPIAPPADAMPPATMAVSPSAIAAEADSDADVLAELRAAEAVVAALEKELAAIKRLAPPPQEEAMAPTDVASTEISDCPIHIRGEVENLGPIVPRGFLQVCSTGDATPPIPTGSGRLELADWLTDPDHPLVSRVFVNRVWMHLMGEGIVRTVDNFGIQGELPSHPELLDAMAIDFLKHGWRLKPLVRSIVRSDAYQRSSRYRSDAAAIDPENQCWWRMPRRRIPAESVRDAMLAVSGQLDRTPRFEPVKDFATLVSKNTSDSGANFEDVSSPCRSIYLPVVRGYLPSLMTALDTADPDLLVGRRPTTNVPTQALALVNRPEVNHWAELAAMRICSEYDDFSSRLQNFYLNTLQRYPAASDHRLAADFFADREDSLAAWHEYIAAMFAATEFRLLD